jgi:hypothetical protein
VRERGIAHAPGREGTTTDGYGRRRSARGSSTRFGA